MQINIQNALDEDKKKVEERLQRKKIMQEEIEKANKAAISLKDEAKLREKKLEEEIMQHQRNKIAREEQEAREAARVREEKEREI